MKDHTSPNYTAEDHAASEPDFLPNWIRVEDLLPELIDQKHGWKQSPHYPVMLEGLKYWCEAYLYQSLDGTFTEWKITGRSGNRKVTHWFNLPEIKLK